ncbi:DNA polymerase-3 subunit delta' [Salinicoccus halodurans]|uniref:DNA polymerase-3 subunit delta n=2 Tax=Salinicoccus halodurans TaxID=407035 RepID=A0A0F7HNI5_9STAP|nr:hypothetical protein AAT16_13810 [Salinicoccus halodurans]SFK66729.1 DNA polymerase-3 subunit delta' [Salinicoccus halodurans]
MSMQTVSAEQQLNRIIESGRLSHTYMFESDAIETLRRQSEHFALKILGKTPRNETLISEGNHPDYFYLRTDETSIKKDAVEDLVRRMNRKPTESDYKVYVIEAFEKLTPQAENSVLKFLEEPPEKTIAILLTIDKSSILPTIHSRSQHIHIKGEKEDRTRFLENLSDMELNTVDVLALNAQHVKDLGENFSVMRKKAIEFSSKWIGNHPLVLIDIKPIVDICTERRDYMLMLQLIDGFVRQSMHASLELESYKPFGAEQVKGRNSIKRLAKMLDEIQTANRMLQSNVHPMLVFESMVICSKG